MLAYRQHLIVENPQQITLKNLPLQVGQVVEVLVSSTIDAELLKTETRTQQEELDKLLISAFGCIASNKTLEEIDEEIEAMW